MTEEGGLSIVYAPSTNGDLLGALVGLAEGELEVHYNEAGNLDAALQTLDDGDVDLLLACASDISSHGGVGSGFEVVGALSLRDWNHVLVSEDRPDHLPKGAIIVSPTRLQRRQLRRLRPDCRVRSHVAHADISSIELPPEVASGDLFAFIEWAERLRSSEEIDGYVIPRHLHRLAGLRTRRHALTTEPKEDSLIRFLPAPHAGLMLVIGRTGFPRNMAIPLLDDEAETAWNLTGTFLDGIDESQHDKIGLSIRHRQPGALLREAEKRRDLLTQEALKNPEGELVHDQVKVEIAIELLDRRGRSSVSMERLADLNDASQAARFMVREWNRLVRLTSEDASFLEL